jgi:chromosomal replication initiation ATPase DnaA
MIQLPFDLSREPSFARSDFLRSESNVAAAECVDRWPNWPSATLVLYGPAGCGKTHLVHLWCERASARLVTGKTLTEATLPRLFDEPAHRVAIDDAHRASERALLHLYNFCVESRGSLLITVRQPPGSWEIALGDLRSRVRAALAVAIEAPDDALLGAVLVKHFADRQLRVAPGVIAYLLRHMERSFADAAKVAAHLDAAALSNGGPVTIPLARRVLADPGYQSLSLRNDSAVT